MREEQWHDIDQGVEDMIHLPEQQSHSWATATNCRGTPSKETIDWSGQRMMRRKGRERRGREEE